MHDAQQQGDGDNQKEQEVPPGGGLYWFLSSDDVLLHHSSAKSPWADDDYDDVGFASCTAWHERLFEETTEHLSRHLMHEPAQKGAGCQHPPAVVNGEHRWAHHRAKYQAGHC